MNACPQCNGELFDNTQKVAGGWKGPVFKCRDKECGWVKWPPKGQGGSGASAGKSPTPRPTGPLAPVYGECMEIASRAVAHYCKGVGVTATASDIVAAAATIFIAATNTGRPVKMAPPPPKPKPAPPPEPEYEPGPDYSDEASLPF